MAVTRPTTTATRPTGAADAGATATSCLLIVGGTFGDAIYDNSDALDVKVTGTNGAAIALETDKLGIDSTGTVGASISLETDKLGVDITGTNGAAITLETNKLGIDSTGTVGASITLETNKLGVDITGTLGAAIKLETNKLGINVTGSGIHQAIELNGAALEIGLTTGGVLSDAIAYDTDGLDVTIAAAYQGAVTESGNAVIVTLPTAWTWLNLASPDLVIAGGVTLSGVGAQDANGYHALTITGDGSTDDGVGEVELLLYDVDDIFGTAYGVLDDEVFIGMMMETSGTLPTNDAIIMVGPVYTSTSGTVEIGVLMVGWSFGSSLLNSRLANTSASNNTTGSAATVKLTATWQPDTDDTSPDMGMIQAEWRNSSGENVSNYQQASVSHSVSTATKRWIGVAIGCDSTSTSANTFTGSGVRIGVRPIKGSTS